MGDKLKLQDSCVQKFSEIRSGLHQSIVGMDDVIDVLFWTLLCQGHGLFIGVPGLAKTLLISTLSELLGLTFNRIQFTPDMMPSDILGSEVLEEDRSSGRRHFEFRKGPIFSQLLLADEINRTPPRTQSALLQAMQERKVTYAGKTYQLEMPFAVFATQNPIESEGTYPLPEAQLDRFLFSIPVSYPNEQDEIEIVKRTTTSENLKNQMILDSQSLLKFQELVREIPVDDACIKQAVNLVRKTRPENDLLPDLKDLIRFGAGPRASQAIILGAKARALLAGRFVVRDEDLMAVAPFVLRHRLVFRRFRDRSDEQVFTEILNQAN